MKKKNPIKVIDFEDLVPNIYFLKSCNSLVIFLTFGLKYLSLKNYEFDSNLNFEIGQFLTLTVSSNLRFFAIADSKISLFDIEKIKQLSISSISKDQISCLIISKKLSFVACSELSGVLSILSFPSLNLLQQVDFNLPDLKFLTLSDNEKLIGCSDYKY